MYKKYKITGKGNTGLIFACLVILFFSLLFADGMNLVIAGEGQVKKVLANSLAGNQEIQQKLDLARINQEFIARVQAKVEGARTDELIQQKIRDYPAGEKMAAFLITLNNAEARGVNTTELLQSFSEQNKVLFKGIAGGSVTGTVTVEGVPPFSDFIEVMAFDNFGFFAGRTSVDPSNGSYAMDLPAGSYYIATRSELVDEFFDNVPIDFFRNWRMATLVTVPDARTSPGIDFDLVRGAKLTGKIYEADGVTPIGFRAVDFEITTATNPEVLFEPSAFTGQNGEYEMNVPATGNFKVYANVFGYQGEFYNNKSDFASADVVPVTSLNDSIANINFSLEESTAPMVEGARIQGTVFGPDSTRLFLAFVFAFDVADTSISGFTISDFTGVYEVAGLDAGTHILYANSYLGFLLGTPPVQGEYYENAKTSAQATPLTVTKTDTLTGKDFTLESGGAIAGKITDANATALDSVLIIAFKDIRTSGVGKFFTDDIDFGISFSDSSGNYILPGLSDGGYILRTVSLLSPSRGMVLDEYYQDVQSIFDFQQAQAVAVTAPDTTSGIDFTLNLAGAISGHFFETDGSTPVSGVGLVIAFDATTGYPELALASSDTLDGSFELRPLPTGNFNLLGLVVDEFDLDLGLVSARSTPLNNFDLFALVDNEKVIYLPQFYDGKASLETADDVPVTAPNVTSNIDFKMVRAATIQGVVNLPSGNPVGADSLAETLVLAYDADTKEVRGGGETTFAGGYRIVGLPPGNYKVEAAPIAEGYAATYHGGGTTFTDANSTVLSIAPDETKLANIDLVTGKGVISGMIYNLDGTIPLPGVLVLAYDQSGHAVSAGMSGFDINRGVPLANLGEYHIPGLVSGSYFVRTFALFQLLTLVEDLGGGLGDDPLTALLGLLLGTGDASLTSLDIQSFGDVWYQAQPVEINLDNLDLFSLLFKLILSGGDPQFILPFFDVVPVGAQLVAVTSPGETTGIDFRLPGLNLSDILSDVEESPDIALQPETFQLFQNYPNPFNPSTVINFSVPKAADIQLQVYNLLGQRIRTLFEGRKAAGVYTTQWDGLSDKGEIVSAGIYFLRLESANLSLTRKMLLVK